MVGGLIHASLEGSEGRSGKYLVWSWVKNSGEEGSRSRLSRVVGGRGKCTAVGGGRESSSRASTAVGRGRGGASVEALVDVFSNVTFLVGAGGPSFWIS